ncbi:glycosyltransferase family 4 protein [Actinoplanes sp. NPDC049265]|uniref:glycosyltransferase family 4 protein n=1 Tax=Actinoplanes sp. NPDC049265 TaxID=3363902 RepID=UPI003722EB6E
MRIRYVLNNAYGAGGTIRTVINQANALCAEHDVEIASVLRTRERPVFPLDPRVNLVSLTGLRDDGSRFTDPPGGNSRFWRKTRRFRNPLPHGRDFRFQRFDPLLDLAIVRYFRRERDGVLITTRPGLNLLAARYAPRDLIRIGQDHMNLSTYKPTLRKQLIRAYPRLSAVAVLTDHDLADWRAALGDSVRLERVPNGIPPVAGASSSPDARYVVAAGRFARQKGFDLLVEAWATVHAKHPDWRLSIFGNGPDREKLIARAAELGFGDSVRMPGITRQIDKELAAASIYVLSSRFEGLPMVLLEAMSHGLPAVAFDCPTGPREVIEDGVNGRLVPAEDVDGLSAALCELIEDPERLRAMGAGALKSSEPFTMPEVSAHWLRFFAELDKIR